MYKLIKTTNMSNALLIPDFLFVNKPIAKIVIINENIPVTILFGPSVPDKKPWYADL